jgi:molybdate transport system ATP-binding protein
MLQVNIKKELRDFSLQTSFQMGKGVLGILGPSGCGKSMTMKCIAGLETANEGTIQLNERILFDSESKIKLPPRKRKIGYVFQNYALFPHLTVSENIAYGIKAMPKALRVKSVDEMVAKMQLKGLEGAYPSKLSGGQQQRVALARTLITQPDVVMLDEPFSALDTHIKHLLEKELIEMIRNNYDGTVLLVTHNIEEAYRMCDKIMIMDQGSILQVGSKKEVIQNPIVSAAARITGCKNIFPVKIVEEKEGHLLVKAKDLVFSVEKNQKKSISKNTEMIAGVRAHHLTISDKTLAKENVFACQVVRKIEGVFSTTLIVNAKGALFQVEITKASCPHLAKIDSSELQLYIPPHQVFLMKQ